MFFIDIEALEKEVSKNIDLTQSKLSEIMELDYSYIYRVLKKRQSYGMKFIKGVSRYCEQFNINPNKFIFLEKPLSKDNTA